MNQKLETALTTVETQYRELVNIADDFLAPTFAPIDELVNQIDTRVNSLSVDQLREYLLMLQLKAYGISEMKERAALKAELAEITQKEHFAISFNGADGSAAVKDKLATVATSAEIATEALYNLVASLLKTKLDAIHRLVDVLKSILMSRMQEAKFMNIGASNDIAPTTDGRITLHS
jgi:phosphopantetheine adenylyltransferase